MNEIKEPNLNAKFNEQGELVSFDIERELWARGGHNGSYQADHECDEWCDDDGCMEAEESPSCEEETPDVDGPDATDSVFEN